MEQIGSIELLRERIYKLDQAISHDPLATDVIVSPGKYPIYQNGSTTLWMMSGRINIGRYSRHGDGMFTLGSVDKGGEVHATFPSRSFGPDEWADLLATPEATEGDPNQRFRILIDAKAT